MCPSCLSDPSRPVPEPEAAYVNECPVSFAKTTLHSSIKSAGNDAPAPVRSTACAAGVALTRSPEIRASTPSFLESFILYLSITPIGLTSCES